MELFTRRGAEFDGSDQSTRTYDCATVHGNYGSSDGSLIQATIDILRIV